MADQTKTKIILRNGTAAQWTAKNPLLLAGEAGIESDTSRVKYGDGVTHWNELEYAAGSKPTTATAWGEITGTLSAQTDLKTVIDSKEDTANKGKTGGYAPLNEEGKVPPVHLSSGFVKGMVTMWSGKLEEIPEGWALCDGQDGRPNLLGKFVRGVGSAGTQPGGTGGANSVSLSTANLPAHAHSVGAHNHSISAQHSHSFSGSTDTKGVHQHVFGDGYAPTSNGYTQWATLKVQQNASGYPAIVNSHMDARITNYRVGGDAEGAHAHAVSGSVGVGGNGISTDNNAASNTSNVGSGAAVSILPTYFELAFIIKL